MAQSQGVPRHFQVSRLLQLIRTSQFAWFVGHLVVLTCAFLFLITFRGGASGFHNTLYRVLYAGVIESFGIIIYQQHFRRGSQTASAAGSGSAAKPSFSQLLFRDDNALYVALAFVWLLTPRINLTMVPYVVFSFFHFLTYVKSVILPQVFDIGANSRLTATIDKFVRDNSDRSMVWSSFSELLCLVLVLLRALLWYRRSWITAIVYCLFIKIRYETSPYMKSGIKKWEVRLDGLVSHPQVPGALKNGYVLFKNNIRELRKYNLSGNAPPKSM